MIHPHLAAQMDAIHKLCEQHQVARLYAFGSVVDGRFKPGKSDIDLLIEFEDVDEKQKAQSLFLLWVSFQQLLQCKVDLISAQNIEGEYFKKYLKLYKEQIFPKN
jgi:hypothetical protein